MGAFAAIRTDGSVVAWGDPACGGDSSEVQDQLFDVRRIQATRDVIGLLRGVRQGIFWALKGAFAAIRGDGRVVAWGSAECGGDCSCVQNRLQNVEQIQQSGRAFAAILSDGTVVTWGDPKEGGDSSAVQEQLRNVMQVQATLGAFAALLSDGSVVAWGNPDKGGDSSQIQPRLRGVQGIHASARIFAAVLSDGTVVSWGDDAYVGVIAVKPDFRFLFCNDKLQKTSSSLGRAENGLSGVPKQEGGGSNSWCILLGC